MLEGLGVFVTWFGEHQPKWVLSLPTPNPTNLKRKLPQCKLISWAKIGAESENTFSM